MDIWINAATGWELQVDRAARRSLDNGANGMADPVEFNCLSRDHAAVVEEYVRVNWPRLTWTMNIQH